MRVQQGQLYNAEDGRKALRDVFALGLFDNVQIFPKPNQKDESKVCTLPAMVLPRTGQLVRKSLAFWVL